MTAKLIYILLISLLTCNITCELVKNERTLPNISINSESFSFLPYQFIDVRKYLPATAANLDIKPSLEKAKLSWNVEGENFSTPYELLQDSNHIKFVELVPQGLSNLGNVKFYYDGPYGPEADKKTAKTCVVSGSEYSDTVWQDHIDLTQEECHRADVSQTNEDDIATTWVSKEGEGDQTKIFINIKIKHIKGKDFTQDKFEDTLGLFKNNEYITTRFVTYKKLNIVTKNDLTYGLKGLIYTKSPTDKKASYYFFEKLTGEQMSY